MSLNQCAPLISILTPTWNRCGYLKRVWDGLNNQTYKNIEWIVCDDGSTDDTGAKLRELGSKAAFPVTVVTASVHIGKARMDNEAIKRARGEFILWKDSDDYLLPQAVEQLVAAWNSIPQESREEYVGIAALCTSQWGIASSPLPNDDIFDTTMNDLMKKMKVGGDMVFLARSGALRIHPFPEVDFVVPESAIWTSIGDQKIRLTPEVAMVKEYQAANCISFSGKMEYSRGRAHAMAICVHNLRSYPTDLKTRLWEIVTYLRYCIHGEINLAATLRLWGGNSNVATLLLACPFSCLLALKDQLQGKVRKTHREFLAAEKKVRLEIVEFPLEPAQ